MEPVYRAHECPTFTVRVRVRGPLGPLEMTASITALDEQAAFEIYVERLQAEGFEVCSTIVPRPRSIPAERGRLAWTAVERKFRESFICRMIPPR